MSTQQDIYVTGSESHPPMLNKENYVPWLSRLLWYAKSIPNGKLIHNSILNGPYVRKMIPEPGDANREITVTETFHLQTDDELSDKELKQIEVDDQTIQTILLGLPEYIYAALDKKKAKLFNEWERFTSNEEESIESYYHHFLKLIKDLKRNKHFPEKIASNLNQLYDFLKYNQKVVDELKVERIAKNQDPLALMANSNNPYVFLAPHKDQSSFNQNYLQQPMSNPEDITYPTSAMNMALALMAKAFKLKWLEAMVEISLGNIQGRMQGTDGSAEVHENCDDNEIFNMFTQEEQYTELLEPIPESHQVPQKDNDVLSEDTSVVITQSKVTPNEPSSQGTSSGGGPRCQEAIGDTIAQTRSERVSKISNNLLLVGVNTPRSGKDRLKLIELMELCTKLQKRVLDLEITKTTQALVIDSLKRRVKKFERRKRSRTYRLIRLYKVGLSARVESFEDEGLGEEDASKQGRIADIDANEDIYLVNVYKDKDMFSVNDLDGDEVIVERVDVAEQAKEVIDYITLAKALMKIKSAKPKALKVKNKGKGKMVELEPVKKLSKKDQLMLDKELTFNLQAEEEKERIAREKAQQVKEVNIDWDDVQAKIDADYKLAKRIQAEE
nr:hypothetical protein [Tanacetum cinerariifolium]